MKVRFLRPTAAPIPALNPSHRSPARTYPRPAGLAHTARTCPTRSLREAISECGRVAAPEAYWLTPRTRTMQRAAVCKSRRGMPHKRARCRVVLAGGRRKAATLNNKQAVGRRSPPHLSPKARRAPHGRWQTLVRPAVPGHKALPHTNTTRPPTGARRSFCP